MGKNGWHPLKLLKKKQYDEIHEFFFGQNNKKKFKEKRLQ